MAERDDRITDCPALRLTTPDDPQRGLWGQRVPSYSPLENPASEEPIVPDTRSYRLFDPGYIPQSQNTLY